MAKEYDVIIIGAGPGGMTAALYASRANLSVLMLDRGIYGGQMNNTAAIENYPGFTSILGPDLGEKMYASATNSGAEYGYGNVTSVEDNGDTKTIHTDDGDYTAKQSSLLRVRNTVMLAYPARMTTPVRVYRTVPCVMVPSSRMRTSSWSAVVIPQSKRVFT